MLFFKPEIARSKGRVALTTNMVMGGTVTDDASDEWLVLDQKVCLIVHLLYNLPKDRLTMGTLRNSDS